MSSDYLLIQDINRIYIKQIDEDAAREKQLLVESMDILIREMRRQCHVFDKLYRGQYYSGSSYDGLKVSSCTKNDFDLNIKFGFPTSKLKIDGLEQHARKMNFAYLKVTSGALREEERALVDQYMQCVSPKKMFRILEVAGDKALTALGWRVVVNGKLYRFGRSVGTPYSLTVSGGDLSISIDLVPAIEFSLNDLPAGDVKSRIEDIQQRIGRPEDVGFMALSLWKVDKERFEIDFHDLERAVLSNRECIKTVIKLLKLIRNTKGGSMEKCWSHLIKTLVMHEVLADPFRGWNMKDIVPIFIGILSAWHERFSRGRVPDLIYVKMNLMDRINEHDQAIQDTTKHLGELLRRYRQDGNLKRVFTMKEYPLAYPAVPSREVSGEEKSDHLAAESETTLSIGGGLLVAAGAMAVAGVAALLYDLFTPKKDAEKKNDRP